MSLSKKNYVITYQGDKIRLRYPTDTDIAVKEGGGQGRFQELKLLERVRAMGLEGTYVDVGANVGNHTLFFAHYCPSDRVIAIEAHPSIFECIQHNILQNNLKSNTQVILMQKAAWHKHEELWMDVPVPGNSGRSQIVGLGAFGRSPHCRTTGEPLDAILAGYDDISLIKLDVEDAEEQALLGARHTIKTQRPVIITEAHNEKFLAAHRAILSPFGYRLDSERYDPRGETRLWITTSKEQS